MIIFNPACFRVCIYPYLFLFYVHISNNILMYDTYSIGNMNVNVYLILNLNIKNILIII